MKERVQLQPAWILRHQPYRDSSLLLEVLSPQHGRMGLVARGVRGKNSARRALLQSFRPLLMSWTGSGDLATLGSCEADGAMQVLSGKALYCGWYVNELCLRLLARRDPHPDLYPIYVATLHRLAAGELEPALRVFEKRLLEETGYGLVLEVGDPASLYGYDFDRGPVEVGPDKPEAMRGDSLQALAQERFSTERQLKDAKRLLRLALRRQLGGRELESVKALKALQQAGQKST